MENGELRSGKALCGRANSRPCGYARCRWVTSGAPRSHATVSSVIKQNPQMPSMTTEQTSCATRISPPGDPLLLFGQFTLCRACAEQPVCVAVRNPALRRGRNGSTLCPPAVIKILCCSPFRSGRRSLICARLTNKKEVGVKRVVLI